MDLPLFPPDPTSRVDERHFPGTRQADGSFDGGDTAAVIGTILALSPASNTIAQYWLRMVQELFSFRGKPRRHWDNSQWYGRDDRFSRDQLIPMICAAIRWRNHLAMFWTLDCYFQAHKRRWFITAWNTKKNGLIDTPDKFPDITGPEIWALWIRFKQPFWARLVLCLLDLELLAGVISWKWRTDRVSRNVMLSTIACRQTMPTLVSRLAFWLLDFSDLTKRWREHCDAVGEYQTAQLFDWELDRMGARK